MNEILEVILGFAIGSFIGMVLIIQGYAEQFFTWLEVKRNAVIAIVVAIVILIFVAVM